MNHSLISDPNWDYYSTCYRLQKSKSQIDELMQLLVKAEKATYQLDAEICERLAPVLQELQKAYNFMPLDTPESFRR